jgi:serine/threonine protein kinase
MSPSERLPVAARIVLRLLEVLAPVHDLGLAHGDITPSSVLLERRGEAVEVRLTDFGLKRHFGRTGEQGTCATPDDLALDSLLRKFAFGLLSAEFPASRPETPSRDEFVRSLRRLAAAAGHA